MFFLMNLCLHMASAKLCKTVKIINIRENHVRYTAILP